MRASKWLPTLLGVLLLALLAASPALAQLAGPVTAWVYDWNFLPVGQLLWLKELETYKQFPPLQSPESWNLDQVTERIRNGMSHPSQ